MKQAVSKLLLTFLIFTALSILQRAIFALCYHSLAPEAGFSMWLASFWHGLPLDLSIAGYLTAIPSLLITAETFTGSRELRIADRIYYGLAAFGLAVIFVLDLVLYAYWGNRLDFSPIFYFTSSPTAAMASASGWMLTGGIFAIIVVAIGIYCALYYTVGRIVIAPSKRPWKKIAWMILLTGCLFLPIRGSVTVAPVNISKAYFCTTPVLNHTAVNPALSLFYSMLQQNDFGKQFRFMDDADAEVTVKEMFATVSADEAKAPAADTLGLGTKTLLRPGVEKPDIYVILLESFSSAIMPSLGGEAVAVGLDSVAHSGLFAERCFASGFRTDRAIPAVVSGFPAQPTTSVMKYVEKAAKLPALPRELAKLGYESRYYYGGDAAFTNMKAYLINSGFKSVVQDSDFPVSSRLSKWGTPDHYVFARALDDIKADRSQSPKFVMIQTSSSHEPFDVPYNNPKFKDNERINAFAYVDSCATDFINSLTTIGKDRNTLVILLADHWGVYPKDPQPMTERFHIPLIITGGALSDELRGKSLSGVLSQIDIPATLLAALGLDATMFEFSKNFLDPSAPQTAVFAGNGTFGYADMRDTLIIDANSKKPIFTAGNNGQKADHRLKAALQTIYRRLSKL